MMLRHIRMCRCNNGMERGAAKSVWDCSFAPPFVEDNVCIANDCCMALVMQRHATADFIIIYCYIRERHPEND